MTVAEAILQSAQLLRQAGVTEPRREAGSLLAHVMSKDRTFIISHAEDLLSDQELSTFNAYVLRRAKGEPLQYITGYQDFFGLEFKVTPEVLIPRPETELLVETALELIGNADAARFVCDVGTGSGCIAITILHERPFVQAVALDISEVAIRIAELNALRHSVNNRISFAVSDCFQSLVEAPRFDLIVSNPPYVPAEALAGLQREVKDHEPRLALTPGMDGLSVIRRLILQAPVFLKPKGYLLVEIGFDQGEAVRHLVDPKVWDLPSIQADLQGIPRILVLQRTG